MKDAIFYPLNIGSIDRALTESHGLSYRLTPDVVQEATRRLGFMSLFILASFLCVFISTELAHFGNVISGHVKLDKPKYLLFILLWILSGILFLLSRIKRLRPQILFDLALVYEVVLAGCLAFLVNLQLDWSLDPSQIKQTPIGIIVIIFSVIIPNTLWKTFIASFLAVLTDPLAVIVLSSLDMIDGPTVAIVVVRNIHNIICVLLALLISRIIYGFGVKVTQARAMGSYELVVQLGKGGMGEVWQAKHRILARPAAIKLIKTEVESDDEPEKSLLLLHRFEREAKATAALRSPHTIEIYDFGLTHDGIFYYVMELLTGLDLDTLVKDYGPQTPERTVFLLRQACHSLHEAHLRGFVHRDIKPANLFICRYGTEVDFLKVLDFGLVKEWNTDESDIFESDPGDAIIGTPAYIAPEMVVGDGKIDGRVDIYALGCVGYRLLTGLHVFEAKTPLAMATLHATETPRRPSGRIPLKIPIELESIIMSCLAKDRDERPQSAKELSQKLADLKLEEKWSEGRRNQWWEINMPNAQVETEAIADNSVTSIDEKFNFQGRAHDKTIALCKK